METDELRIINIDSLTELQKAAAIGKTILFDEGLGGFSGKLQVADTDRLRAMVCAKAIAESNEFNP